MPTRGNNELRGVQYSQEKLDRVLAALVTVVGVVASVFHLHRRFCAISTMDHRVTPEIVFPLVFIAYAASSRDRNRIRWFDLMLAGLVVAFVSISWQLRAQMTRIAPPVRWNIFGCALIIVVIEAAGGLPVALAGTATVFLAFALLGPYFLGFAHKGIDSEAYIVPGHDSRGIYALHGVSATYVVLFVLFGAFLSALEVNCSSTWYATGRALRLSKTAIVSSALMGTISGSPIANVVTTGTFTIPLMSRLFGYGRSQEANHSPGMIMPPVMGLLFNMACTECHQSCIRCRHSSTLYYLCVLHC